MVPDENEYMFLKRQLLDQPTINQHRRAKRTATTMNYDNFDPNIDPLVKAHLLRRKQRANSTILHLKYAQRFPQHS
jgi:hypothetical protein